jgi:outer membrane protein assembly factor BamB
MRFTERGTTVNDTAKATEGYTLFAPIRHAAAYLIDMDGNEVHRWQLGKGGTNPCHLTDNGNLFIAEESGDGPPLFAGKCGMMREYDWDGNVVWEHRDDNQHHDARRLDNGNTLYIAWQELDGETANRVQGGIPGTELDGKIYGDWIRETTPDGNLVWEWSLTEMDLENYPICPLCTRAEYAHANTCSPLPSGDVMVTVRALNLIFIIDAETKAVKWEYQDLSLGHPHDGHVLENGNVMVFANGFHGRYADMWSRVIEFDADTKETKWEFTADPITSFYSGNISGAQRLWSGNTLICEGAKGCLFEVTPAGEIVWEYVNPHEVNHSRFGDVNWIFRAHRYRPGAPQLQGRF